MSATVSNTLRPAAGKTSGTFVQLLGARWEALAGYFVRRAAVATLRALDERALQDIGLDRTDIEAAVYGRVTPFDQERM